MGQGGGRRNLLLLPVLAIAESVTPHRDRPRWADSWSASTLRPLRHRDVRQCLFGGGVDTDFEVSPNPSFEVDLSGIYTFYLVVYDENNTPSCFPAEYEVAVIPDEAIRIELFWHTPGDPDETDSGPAAGADLDLHLLHPLAEGPDIDNDGEPNGWFDVPWDCFWYNPSPDWSPPGPEGNPVCPEKNYDYCPEFTTFTPGEELTYRVGVHDWDDHGYGPSYATVRVYLYGTLAFEFADVKLQKLLTWEVCEIEWPSGKIEPILDEDGEPNILPPINCGFTGCPPWE